MKHCSLCGDEALPAVVVSVDAASRTAEVEMDDCRRTVCLDLVEDVRAGQILLVHQGFAIGRVEPE